MSLIPPRAAAHFSIGPSKVHVTVVVWSSRAWYLTTSKQSILKDLVATVAYGAASD